MATIYDFGYSESLVRLTSEPVLLPGGEYQLVREVSFGSFKKIIFPGEGSFGGTTDIALQTVVNIFANGLTGQWTTNVMVPMEAIGFKEIRVYYISRVSGNISWTFNGSVWPLSLSGAARQNFTQDDFITTSPGSGAGIGIARIIYNPDDKLNIRGGDIVGTILTRNGGAAADTYENDLEVIGLEYIFLR